MAYFATYCHLHRNLRYGLKNVVRPFSVGEQSPEKPSAGQTSTPEKQSGESSTSEKPSKQNTSIREARAASNVLPDIPYWKIADRKITAKSFDEIPGPKPIPFLGNIWRYWPIVGQYSFVRLHETYASFYKQYGYVVKEKVHHTRTIVHVFHPEDIASVYQSDGKYPLRQSHSAMSKYRRERPHLYTSVGLGPSNGVEWFGFRKRFLEVNSAAIIAMRRPKIEMITDELVKILGRGLNRQGEIDVRQPLFRWALEGVGMVTLERRLGCLDPKNEEADKLIKAAHATHDAIYKVENHMSPLVQWREYRRLVQAQDFFAEVIRKYMHQTLADSSGPSLLYHLLNRGSREITTQDVFTLILDLFQGGIHSVSYSVSFALLHLAMNKDKQDILRSVLIEKLPDKDTMLSTTKRGTGLHYLDYVNKETLRMSPPTIGTGRILNKDVVLGGYKVPAGTMVILHNQIAAMLPEYFKDPHLFKPERFSGNDPGVIQGIGSYANLPFGYGMRGCIGTVLARMEMNLAVAKIIRNYEVSYHHEPVGIVNKLHNEPDKPVLLRFKKVDH